MQSSVSLNSAPLGSGYWISQGNFPKRKSRLLQVIILEQLMVDMLEYNLRIYDPSTSTSMA